MGSYTHRSLRTRSDSHKGGMIVVPDGGQMDRGIRVELGGEKRLSQCKRGSQERQQHSGPLMVHSCLDRRMTTHSKPMCRLWSSCRDHCCLMGTDRPG